MSWTQAICERCWGIAHPGMEPTRLIDPEFETCCFCGAHTDDGIYVRIDPRSVPYPRKVKS
jgi:hypothetical protein